MISNKLKKQWEDTYAAFKGIFDTPEARFRLRGDYEDDARKRLNKFNDAILSYNPRAHHVATMRYLSGIHPWWSFTSMAHVHEALEVALGLPHEPWKGDGAYPEEWTLENLGLKAKEEQEEEQE